MWQLRAPAAPPATERFVPAPVTFTPSILPSYTGLRPAKGPASAAALAAAAPPGPCQTIGAVLAAIPEASQWLQLLKNAGLDGVLLSDPKVQATVMVPVNSAFAAGIDLEPLRAEKTMGDLVRGAPEVVGPLAGSSALRGLFPSSTLQPGSSLPTATTLDKVNPLRINVTSRTRLQGVGSSATILQADLAACGPSVVHVVDQILLPFSFDQAPADAVAGTQVPGLSKPTYTLSAESGPPQGSNAGRK